VAWELVTNYLSIEDPTQDEKLFFSINVIVLIYEASAIKPK
jgi:hypothetical protein